MRPTEGDRGSATPPEPPPLARLRLWQIQAFRDVLVVAAALSVVWVGYLLRAVTVPLLVALLLAYLFEPLVRWLARRPHMNRGRAVAGILAVVLLGFVLLLSLVIPLVVAQTVQLTRDVRDGHMRQRVARLEAIVPEPLRQDFRSLLDVLPDRPGPAPRPVEALDQAEVPEEAAAPAAAPALTEQRVREIAEEAVRGAAEAGKGGPDWLGVARGGAQALGTFLGTLVQIGLLAFLIPFYFFFFSLWYSDVLRFARGLVPERNRARILAMAARMDQVVSGFVRGRIVISMIMGALLAVGWMLCGVPYALLLGLVIGIFCAVPYLGGIGVPLAVGLLFVARLDQAHDSGPWWVWILVWPTVVFVVVQVIEGYLLTPMIAGKATNLDPVTIIVAVLAGGSVLGVYGMLLAIPVAACLKIVVTDLVLPKLRAWAEGRAADPLPIERE
jgi:predicted PurR-regulated permease PerM